MSMKHKVCFILQLIAKLDDIHLIDTHKTIPLSTLIYQVLGIPAIHFYYKAILGCPIAANNKTLYAQQGHWNQFSAVGRSPPTPDFGGSVNPIAIRGGDIMSAKLLFILTDFLTFLQLCKVVYFRGPRNFLPLLVCKLVDFMATKNITILKAHVLL